VIVRKEISDLYILYN